MSSEDNVDHGIYQYLSFTNVKFPTLKSENDNGLLQMNS